ncbi:HAD family hydrolase [Faecalicatena orotica]|uniref:Phosphoglycolate phosphatase-like HAD superfamily hydrolase n=1 Tax=Faecalicatena orotica TaxID=1544 RepID=A0A2Y9BDB1_9FIRM|nr:HAD hydrolase-like protein [Faecalicatena orotica]PWJ32433.1 phosphoglycolate phosphatase-like HAD superfamily hydrolase [Faecalicatena orotica]SSA54268.1 Phosphoglycolate phosphatase, HAD superfamily [Faecalicatena orotica]
MSNPFSDFSKKKEYLVCIDSDGCAIDSMDIKHIRCFGPCMITEWGLDAHREEILKRWNQVNLYSMTRGINRFKGLAAALEEADRLYAKIEDVQTFVKWTEDSDELSNAALEQAIDETGSICMKKALNWSREVNKAITELPKEDIRPFEHVQDVIRKLHETCDIAIVSSANYEAVKEEWTRFGLLTYVDVLLAQNAGSKKSCIERLLTYGYAKEHVLMTGDAPGDMDAAQSNGVLYYPILVSHESESWEQLEAAVEKVKNNTFQGEYQAGLIQQFVDNLTKP